MSRDLGTDRELSERLLDLPDTIQRTDFLREAGMLNAEGLNRLLDTADGFLSEDPDKARRLAEFCADTANIAEAPAAVPRANYVLAGVHNLNGEFEEDLRLTKAAHDGFVALGMNLEALRTDVGKMPALFELGRYQDALSAANAVLDTLEGKTGPDMILTQYESDLLAAMAHQNRGACYEHMGLYEEALKAWERAKKHYQALGMTERLGEIIDNQGVVLRHLGRGNEALDAHETAIAIFDKEELILSYAKSLGNLGDAQLQLGNYMSALQAFEQARRLLSSIGALVDERVMLLDTANVYLALNLYSEALVNYRRANELLESTGMVYEHARGLWGMGSVLIARTGFDEAEKVLIEASALFELVGNKPLLSGVMLEQASLLEVRGDWVGALAKANRALELVSGKNSPVQLFYAHLRLADLLLPNTEAAKPHLKEAQRLADGLALPHLSYRLNERLGRLRQLQGRYEEARVLLEAAVEEIERLRGTVAQDSMRASFLRDKVAAYENLLQLYLDREDEEHVRRAFTVAERAKSRALVDLLIGVAEKEPEASAHPDLTSRLRTLQADLNAVYNELLGDSCDRRRVPLAELQARAAELEGEIGRLRLHAAAAGSTSELFAEPIPLEVIQGRMSADDVTLLSYHVVGDEVLAFVDTGDSTRVVRRLSTAAKVRKLSHRLAAQWNRFRMGPEFAERNMKLLERSSRQILAALYDELLAPLEPILREIAPLSPESQVPKLAIVPHGPLHQIPFHALFDGERYLIERFEISYAPSATVYALCQKQEARDPTDALVFGVEDPSIPAAAVEARIVAEHFPDARVRVGGEATLETLREEAADRGALHLACHGLFRADNPMFSALKLHDGWLTAADAMVLDLAGALVTLSACESGRTEVIGGDELIGLTRAFLGAGAATLVVSLWLAQDDTTAELMGRFYELLRGGADRAAALRAAQLETKERHPHPYYWAPFVLIGKR